MKIHRPRVTLAYRTEKDIEMFRKFVGGMTIYEVMSNPRLAEILLEGHQPAPKRSDEDLPSRCQCGQRYNWFGSPEDADKALTHQLYVCYIRGMWLAGVEPTDLALSVMDTFSEHLNFLDAMDTISDLVGVLV